MVVFVIANWVLLSHGCWEIERSSAGAVSHTLDIGVFGSGHHRTWFLFVLVRLFDIPP